MMTGQELVLDLSEQMNTIKLPLMALKLDELYRSPDYPGMDKLDFLSALLAPEFRDKVTKTTNNRLRTARLIGTPCEIESCVDSSIRRYVPHGMPEILRSLQFIEDGLNVCILGASDSGKTYLAKAIGTVACARYRVSYNRCNELLEHLVAMKAADHSSYEKRIRKLLNFHLLILDDFLMNTIADEREIKILMEIMEKRIELSTPHERPSQLRMKIMLVLPRRAFATLKTAGIVRLHLGGFFTPFVQRGRIAQENNSM